MSAGTKRTRSADHTRPAAPTCANHPARAATGDDASASGTTAIPASCATPISGIARKFKPSPANVTRENSVAPTGNSIASAAADAAKSATGADSTRAKGNRDRTTSGTTMRMASVAPNVSRKPGSAIESGSIATSTPATTARALSGGLR